jgi:hypothetical protein
VTEFGNAAIPDPDALIVDLGAYFKTLSPSLALRFP